jgi:hypothetical protein
MKVGGEWEIMKRERERDLQGQVHNEKREV